MAKYLLLLLLFCPLALAQQTETFEWDEPTEREDGTELPADEIGGYEFRFYENGGEEFEAFLLPRGSDPVTSYSFAVPSGTHEFEVAAYDTDGLYSEFVLIEATTEEDKEPPNPVGQFRRTTDRDAVDPVDDCLSRSNCTVLE